jgi:undecaprenyl-diphosphatase
MHLTIFQAFILGLAQALGEFLPISSSAHLILIPWLLKWKDPGLTFDVALHIGTLFAVVAFFWKDWLILLKNGLGKGLKTREGKMFWFLVIASVPAAFTGIVLEKQVETTFRNPFMIGIVLILVGLFLYVADRFGTKQQQEPLSLSQSFIIGISQALAIVPGVSRSGITISSGLLLGLSRQEAARFSFLLSTPIITGAGLLKIRHLSLGAINFPFLVGILTSAFFGFLVIGFLLKWLRKSSFALFVWYRLLLGLSIFGILLVRNNT